MTIASVLTQYKENAVFSAPPERLVIMLYDGALKNLKLALEALDNDNRGRFGNHISKSNSIVAELLSNLNHDAAPELTKNLEKLYLFVIDKITDANLKLNGGSIREAIKVMETLKEGWDYAVKESAC